MLPAPWLDMELLQMRLEPDRHVSALAVFSRSFRALRTKIFVKQAALSSAVRCTEAAISYWESGRRLPLRPSFVRIVEALGEYGATVSELDALEGAWRHAMVQRALESRQRSR
jgi:DNA-binding transcriptional regulator YiaG